MLTRDVVQKLIVDTFGWTFFPWHLKQVQLKGKRYKKKNQRKQ